MQAVRSQLGLQVDLGDADEPLRTQRQLLHELARAPHHPGRYDEAVASGAPSVTNWGTGSPRRGVSTR